MSSDISKQAMQATTDLINATNRLSSDKEVARGMAEALIRNHPTLVQSFFRAVRDASVILEDDNKFNDGRCEASGKLVSHIAKFEEPLPFI